MADKGFMGYREAECGRALSVRQPFAELILRGVKTVEYRSRATRVIGERFLIYASKKRAGRVWSNDLEAGATPAWLAEVAGHLGLFSREDLERLPTGVIVGSAVTEAVRPLGEGMFGWQLADVRRAGTLRPPNGRPQPVWFRVRA